MVNINNKVTLNVHVCMYAVLAYTCIVQTYLSHYILLYFYCMKKFMATSIYYVCKHVVYILTVNL